MDEPLPLIRAEMYADRETSALLEAFLYDRVPIGWEEEETEEGMLYRIHLERTAPADVLLRDLAEAFPQVRLELSDVPNRNWAAAWREFFTAVLCGEHFVVIAPWMQDEHPYKERIPIIIEPKTAFGTGHHATTAMCLELISDLQDRGRLQKGMDFLDLGTGSGVLGFGLAQLGLTGLGLDTDPLAIENAVENRELNRIGDEFRVREGSINECSGRTFDIVVANILAEPLIELAPAIRDVLRPGGILILSGLLAVQKDKVREAYEQIGFAPPEEKISDEWAALVYTKD